MREAVEGDVADEEHRAEQDGQDNAARFRRHGAYPAETFADQVKRVKDDVPTVPAQEAPRINSETAERRHDGDEEPAAGPAEAMRDHALHEEEGEETKDQSGHREEQDEDEVRPVVALGFRTEMDEIGEDVGRVRKEEEPAGRRSNEGPAAWTSVLFHPAGGEREEQRQPG